MDDKIRQFSYRDLPKRVYNIEERVKEIEGGSGGGADLIVSITHADLLTLVNNSELVAGQQYRLTDYVATVDESVYDGNVVSFFARSNNHAFDIIVTADSINQLNENARAIRHEGDTYFPSHTKFEAWRLKYTIFNGSERFDWAVSSGKGVIYQLIDEWNNDLPYDFKSIQFKRNDIWVYTFGGIADNSLKIQNCYENKMLRMYSNINTYGYGLNDNTFGDYCHANTLGYGCLANTFGNYCSSNTFGKGCLSNTFEGSCESNTFGNDCFGNTFGDSCSYNTFGNYCGQNTFGDNYGYFNINSNISNKDFTTLILLFTTPPNNNEIKVTSSVDGAVMSQVINATTTESIDI